MTTLTTEAIDRTIVLDFEGFMNQPPVLAGTLVDGAYNCMVFTDVEPALCSAADASGCGKSVLRIFLDQLLKFSIREHRHIAAYTECETNVFRELGLSDLSESPRFINIRPPAKRWRKKVHPEAITRVRRITWVNGRYVESGNRLVDFVPLLGQRIPKTHAAGKTTNRLRHVIGQLKRWGYYSNLTPTAKRKWTNLLKHNRRDCEWASMLLQTTAEF